MNRIKLLVLTALLSISFFGCEKEPELIMITKHFKISSWNAMNSTNSFYSKTLYINEITNNVIDNGSIMVYGKDDNYSNYWMIPSSWISDENEYFVDYFYEKGELDITWTSENQFTPNTLDIKVVIFSEE